MFLLGAYHEYTTSRKNIGNTKKILNGYVPIKMNFAPFTWMILTSNIEDTRQPA